MGRIPTNNDETFYLKYTIGILKDGRKTQISIVQTSGTNRIHSEVPPSGDGRSDHGVRHPKWVRPTEDPEG